MSASSQQTFLQGLGLGIGAAALLFYFWHTEAVYQLQQQWLAQQQAQLQALQQKPSAAQNIETIDLLMKSYAISDGNEDMDMRSVLIQSGHMKLLQQVQQQTNIDLSDLISETKPFNSAQLYAALLRMKQAQEKLLARTLLDQRLEAMVSDASKGN